MKTLLTHCALALALPLALAGCEIGDGTLDSDTTPTVEAAEPAPEQAPVDLLDDQALAAPVAAVDEILAGDRTANYLPGLYEAERHVREQVELEFGVEALAVLPDDLVQSWIDRPEAGDSVDADARYDDGDDNPCDPVAVIGGIWTNQDPNHLDYAGLWWAPQAYAVGLMAGNHRNLATPGGQWAGGFGTFDQRLGPQGGMYFRDFDGTGTFGGMWSVPMSPYEGVMGGHWVRVSPNGGFYFGVMTVCPW